MKHTLREAEWMLVGFLGMAAIFITAAVIWGNHIEHRIDRIVVQHHGGRRAITKPKHEIPKGVVAGSGSNPSGQPAPGEPAHSGQPNPSQQSTPPTSAPVLANPQTPPAPSISASTDGPEQSPGLLGPVLQQAPPILDCHLTAAGISVCN